LAYELLKVCLQGKLGMLTLMAMVKKLGLTAYRMAASLGFLFWAFLVFVIANMLLFWPVTPYWIWASLLILGGIWAGLCWKRGRWE
jgi:hypothetical protein